MQWSGVHDLIDRAKRGDQSAWHLLFQMVQPFLLRVASQVLGPNWPEKSVSDLFQDTWTRALPKLSEFRGGENDAQTGAAFRAWLAQTMQNVHRNIMRADGRMARRAPSSLIHPDALRCEGSHSGDAWSDVNSGEPTASVQLRLEERAALVLKAIDGLPEIDQALVRFRFFDELSYVEIAQRMGIDESTVRYRLQRILDGLGLQLQGVE